jgi:hypothetical protein
MKASTTLNLLLCFFLLCLEGCDQERDEISGSSNATPAPDDLAQGNQIADAVSGDQDMTGDDGFCEPAGGLDAVGSASYSSNSTAQIDTDGDPGFATKRDGSWNPNTSGKVNGQNVNSAKYAYIVMSPGQMSASHVRLGDWALVQNLGTGQSTWARVEDVGPAGKTGEISEAAATAVGIGFDDRSFTYGNPKVAIKAFAGTRSIAGDCPPKDSDNQT